jgi:hypothetical protein
MTNLLICVETQCSKQRPCKDLVYIQTLQTHKASQNLPSWFCKVKSFINLFLFASNGFKVNIVTLTADCKNEGVILTPSVKKVTGANRKKDITVMIEKRLMLSKDS